MNQEDILKMAREADPEFDSDPEDRPYCLMGMGALERFAALVAAKAAQDEREACALMSVNNAMELKSTADLSKSLGDAADVIEKSSKAIACFQLAAAIRARV